MSSTIEMPLSVPDGIPGFRNYDTATLVRGDGNVMAFRIGGASLPVAVPWEINPDFGFRFKDEDVAELGEPSDWTLLLVVNLPRGTVNQFAPIVVNEAMGVARQVVNRAGRYSTRDPFVIGGEA